MKGYPLGMAKCVVIALLTLGLSSCATTTHRTTPAEDLVNLRLSPGWAQWLVGPIAYLATREEVDEYLSLATDELAEQFARSFWRRRNPEPGTIFNASREAFDKRVEEATSRFSEAGVGGQRTARGTIFVIYGPPSRVEFEVGPVESEIGLEVWYYDDSETVGLDGQRRNERYRFFKPGDMTLLYNIELPSDPAKRSRVLN